MRDTIAGTAPSHGIDLRLSPAKINPLVGGYVKLKWQKTKFLENMTTAPEPHAHHPHASITAAHLNEKNSVDQWKSCQEACC